MNNQIYSNSQQQPDI